MLLEFNCLNLTKFNAAINVQRESAINAAEATTRIDFAVSKSRPQRH